MNVSIELVAALRKQVNESRQRLADEEAALRVVERMAAVNGAQPDYASGDILNATGTVTLPAIPEQKSLRDDIRDVIKRFGSQEFIVAHVDLALKQQGITVAGKSPRSRISMILSDLEKRKEIERTFKGIGSAPHRFRIIDAPQNGVDEPINDGN